MNRALSLVESAKYQAIATAPVETVGQVLTEGEKQMRFA
jgi:hypothetical protein